MGQLNNYTFSSRSFLDSSGVGGEFDCGFVGYPVDERGAASVDAVRSRVNNLYEINFDPKLQATSLDGNVTIRSRLIQKLAGVKNILVDATTLGVGEILQILLVSEQIELKHIEFLYVEPGTYSRIDASAPEDRQLRHFNLTKNHNYVSVQGFAKEFDPNLPASHVFMLGFEPGRVQNAFEQRGDLSPALHKVSFIVGVPAFQTGWEMNTLQPHLSVFEGLSAGEHNISYCAANSIRESYLALWDLFKQLGDERRCFFVCPLGTKPSAVGASLFLFETRSALNPTSLYFDHPSPIENLSEKLGMWHQVVVNFVRQ